MRVFDYRKFVNYLWDSETLSFVAQIHEFKGRQEQLLKGKPTELKRLIEIAKVRSTLASNQIEGIVTTDTRLRQLCADQTTPRNRDESEILGYRDVLNLIHENYEYIDIRASYILQLHRDLYQYSEKSIGGRFKNIQNYITEKRRDGVEFVRFTPLPPYETPDAIEAICRNFKESVDRCDADPLILICVFILDFLCIHPFNDGNGRMSRLLTTLLLQKCGYEIGKYVSLESLIERSKNIYYEALKASSQNWQENAEDAAPFIKYLLGIILAAYRDFEDKTSTLSQPKLNALGIVRSAIEKKIGKFTKRDILESCPNISEASVENSLKTLVTSGEINRHGIGRSTFYTKSQT